MINAPKISVIMSVYNGQKYLNAAIESIQNQTESDFEFIIINDCSTDDSLTIINSYQRDDDRIIVIDNEVNLKLPASLNRGINIAKGKYIARMDADDIALPQRLKLQYDAMESNSDLDFIGGMVECFYNDENINNAYANAKYMEDIHFNFIANTHNLVDTKKLIEKSTYITTRICHSTLFGKTSAFRELMYTEDVFAEDWDLYNRAINRGYSISKIPDFILRYRIVNSGMCGSFNEQPTVELNNKIKKLNDGILNDCIKTKSYKNACKFYWYHYIKPVLARFKNLIIGKVRYSIKYIVLKLMAAVYKSLNTKQLKKVKRIMDAANRRSYIRKLPFIGKVIAVCLQKLNENTSVIYDKFDVSEPRFNIGVWTIEKKWAMGGLNTIFKLIPTLISNGHKVRIINYGFHSDELIKSFYGYISDIINITNNDAECIELISATTYRHNIIKFNPLDNFIAGFWEPAEDFIAHRELNYFKNDRFVYIIQDYEPSMLYRWGSEYIRSKDTLCDNNYYPIFNNSEFVCGYMKQLGIIDSWKEDQMLHGEPCDTSPAPVSEMIENNKNVNIVFYSRPTVDKNIYDIKIKALKKLIDFTKLNMPDIYSKLSITGIGEDTCDVVHNGFTIKNLGKVDFKQYPSLLRKFNVGLSCIISPAFAYPCIEFPRAGIVTVVNRFENRDLEKYSDNIISCDNTAESIFNSLLKAIELVPQVEMRISASKFQLPGVSIDIAAEAMLSDLKS